MWKQDASPTRAMNALGGDSGNNAPQMLWEDAERVFCRFTRNDAEGDRHAFMPKRSGAEHPMLHGARRLTHEHELRGCLDARWALRPVELVREHGQTTLFVEFSGGVPLDRSLGVTFYEMLTGRLPFTASDPMEWVHCHIARHASCRVRSHRRRRQARAGARIRVLGHWQIRRSHRAPEAARSPPRVVCFRHAIEAMAGVEAEVRELVISTELSPSQDLLVTVGDTGPGIAPEHRERVFESFYTTKSGGLGIGLSLCRSIIDAHGGKLWADAHQPRGAVFRFTLPALS